MNFVIALRALGVRNLLPIIELDIAFDGIADIIIASIIGFDIVEEDIVFDMGFVEDMDIIGLVVIDIIGLEDMDIIGLVEDMGIIELVKDMVAMGSADIAIAGLEEAIAIIRPRVIMFLANLDIIERTARIVGDVVII